MFKKLIRILRRGTSQGARAQRLDESLLRAAREGDSAEVARLVDRGALAVAREAKTLRTAFHWAVRHGDKAMAASMLEVSDAKASDRIGDTPLMLAAKAGNPGLVAALVAVSEVDARQREPWDYDSRPGRRILNVYCGETALMSATRSGCLRCVEILLPHANARLVSSLGETALGIAARAGRADLVGAILPCSQGMPTEFLPRALALATASGSAPCVAAIAPLAEGSKFYFPRLDEDGTTLWPGDDRFANMNPLEIAIATGRADLARIIMVRSDPDALGLRGRSALALAAAQGEVECVKLLAPVGRHDIKDQDGLTPLMLAAKMGYAPIVEVLLRHAEATLLDQREALGVAVEHGHLDCARLIFDMDPAGLCESLVSLAMSHGIPRPLEGLFFGAHIERHRRQVAVGERLMSWAAGCVDLPEGRNIWNAALQAARGEGGVAEWVEREWALRAAQAIKAAIDGAASTDIASKPSSRL